MSKLSIVLMAGIVAVLVGFFAIKASEASGGHQYEQEVCAFGSHTESVSIEVWVHGHFEEVGGHYIKIFGHKIWVPDYEWIPGHYETVTTNKEVCNDPSPVTACVNGDFITGDESDGIVPTNDCDPVRLCVDGESMTVTEFDAESLDGEKGSCTPEGGGTHTVTIPEPVVPVYQTCQLGDKVFSVLDLECHSPAAPEVVHFTPPPAGDGGLK